MAGCSNWDRASCSDPVWAAAAAGVAAAVAALEAAAVAAAVAAVEAAGAVAVAAVVESAADVPARVFVPGLSVPERVFVPAPPIFVVAAAEAPVAPGAAFLHWLFAVRQPVAAGVAVPAEADVVSGHWRFFARRPVAASVAVAAPVPVAPGAAFLRWPFAVPALAAVDDALVQRADALDPVFAATIAALAGVFLPALDQAWMNA